MTLFASLGEKSTAQTSTCSLPTAIQLHSRHAIDFINNKRMEGTDLKKAVILSGVKRFRPIFLTSITTFAGLIPLMFDRAIHAQFLKPMAVSLGFGILFATVITLMLIPCLYLVLYDLKALFSSKSAHEIVVENRETATAGGR